MRCLIVILLCLTFCGCQMTNQTDKGESTGSQEKLAPLSLDDVLCDPSKWKSRKKFAAVSEQTERLHGDAKKGLLFEYTRSSKDLWDKVISLNLSGPFLYSQAAAQAMISAGKGGRIINMASVDGIRPTGFMAHYNSSKGGIIMLTKNQTVHVT